MFEIGTQIWISRSHGYLEVCLKSPKVRDTDISLYLKMARDMRCQVMPVLKDRMIMLQWSKKMMT